MGGDKTETPLERVERQLSEYREANNLPAGEYGMEYEAGKLGILEHDIDWSGVRDKDKAKVLAREVDFSKITRDDLNAVYEAIGSDDVDERPARRLFDEANFANAVAQADAKPFSEQLKETREATRHLVQSVWADEWPRPFAIVDFGLDSQTHYEALYYPIRNHEIAPVVLDAAMGNGAKLTELVANAPSNPHKNVQFYTSWDSLLGREPEGRETEAYSPDPYSHGDTAPDQAMEL